MASSGERSKRRQLSPEFKYQVVLALGKVPVSQICEEFGVSTSQIYAWKKRAEEGAKEALASSGGRKVKFSKLLEGRGKVRGRPRTKKPAG